MKNFKSITIPESTFKILDKLKYRITKVPLSKSKVVTVIYLHSLKYNTKLLLCQHK